MELPILFFLVAGMLVYSLSPLFGPRKSRSDEPGAELRRRIADLDAEKANTLRAIKDVEFERATGKLSDEDHEELHSLYTRKAAEILADLETLRNEADRADDIR